MKISLSAILVFVFAFLFWGVLYIQAYDEVSSGPEATSKHSWKWGPFNQYHINVGGGNFRTLFWGKESSIDTALVVATERRAPFVIFSAGYESLGYGFDSDMLMYWLYNVPSSDGGLFDIGMRFRKIYKCNESFSFFAPQIGARVIEDDVWGYYSYSSPLDQKLITWELLFAFSGGSGFRWYLGREYKVEAEANLYMRRPFITHSRLNFIRVKGDSSPGNSTWGFGLDLMTRDDNIKAIGLMIGLYGGNYRN